MHSVLAFDYGILKLVHSVCFSGYGIEIEPFIIFFLTLLDTVATGLCFFWHEGTDVLFRDILVLYIDYIDTRGWKKMHNTLLPCFTLFSRPGMP